MLKFVQVTKYYDDVKAADDVSFELTEGEMFGLVGPNGSGKSTLLKIMLGIIKPTAGQILVGGAALKDKDWLNFRRLIGYMPERVSFYDNLTGMATLELFASIKGGSITNIEDVLAQLLSREVLARKVGTYSKGMRQRLNLAQALLNDPSLLVLDEPTSGLDPIGTRLLYDILDGVRKRKKLTVVLSTHMLAEVEEKVSRVGIMKNGVLKATGTLDELYRGLNLPLRLIILVNEDDPQGALLSEILKQEGAVNITYAAGQLTAELPVENKLNMLASILGQKDKFVDFTLRQPSLEEVFFGIH
ncbi:ABC transporter ATP-binding protein [Candidatus Magnetominusculus xianensis]|uniref:Copper ABC transporter ATP-binding protein n=1 Tax=Candidatus Magnetominusculus xianensis TaxID=1748249 RepID=A0ABR5SBF9_9BACT|nr:ABC transporter ATP-binding protein [Candidatus Magnetominusculus xianensis]KWT76419.1 copper ABC transporter ATP-binding protein [Candidatus Magnetominusculus xianensis]MBF0404888.1 ABC transporter ATP-binding protein [Nitrospirota bacterium]